MTENYANLNELKSHRIDVFAALFNGKSVSKIVNSRISLNEVCGIGFKINMRRQIKRFDRIIMKRNCVSYFFAFAQ